jgi:hypothetical protein
MTYVNGLVLSDFGWDIVVYFVDIDGIVDHRLNFLVIINWYFCLQMTGVRVHNVFNDFIMLANTQFIENVSS